MGSYQLVDEADVTEPIDLADQKVYSGVDVDYAVPDSDIQTAIAAARQRVEAHINVGLVKRDVIVQWDGCKIDLPLSPTGTIEYVKKDGVLLTTDDYTISAYNAKSIYINNMAGSDYNYFYGINGDFVEVTPINGVTLPESMYEVKYSTGHETLPQGLRLSIMAECDFLNKLKGQPPMVNISPNAAMLARKWNRNLVI